jgi:hypothetical protein
VSEDDLMLRIVRMHRELNDQTLGTNAAPSVVEIRYYPTVPDNHWTAAIGLHLGAGSSSRAALEELRTVLGPLLINKIRNTEERLEALRRAAVES